jgi:class 3 adenylate cyclase
MERPAREKYLWMNGRLPRKLAVILYADRAGYSRLTGADEEATHKTFNKYLDLSGQTIGNSGDSVPG